MFDGHCHLDKTLGSCQKAMKRLYQEARDAGVEGMILLNIPEMAFANEDVLEEAKGYEGFFRVFPALDPAVKGARKDLKRYCQAGAKGLKLHPRFHGYHVFSPKVIDIVRTAATLGIPVLSDAFPDGKNLLLKNGPVAFARLAEAVPTARLAVAHSCGHHILDLLMLAKTFKNLYLDLSFSWLYYRGSSFGRDAVYAAASLKGERIFWGTDYPDRGYADSIRLSQDLARELMPDPRLHKKVFALNAPLFLGEQGKEGAKHGKL